MWGVGVKRAPFSKIYYTPLQQHLFSPHLFLDFLSVSLTFMSKLYMVTSLFVSHHAGSLPCLLPCPPLWLPVPSLSLHLLSAPQFTPPIPQFPPAFLPTSPCHLLPSALLSVTRAPLSSPIPSPTLPSFAPFFIWRLGVAAVSLNSSRRLQQVEAAVWLS